MVIMIFLILACIAIVVFCVPYGLISSNPFPTPSGQWKVGTDELFNLNTTTDSWLYRKINPTKIFTAGHSSGGSASFLACGTDSRIAKSVNLDGFLYVDRIDIAGTEKEFLLILSNRDKYASQNSSRLLLHHFKFGDVPVAQ
jgi:dienelactone hydrolase